MANGLQPRVVFSLPITKEGKPEKLCPGWTASKLDLTTFEPSSVASDGGHLERIPIHTGLQVGMHSFRDPFT